MPSFEFELRRTRDPIGHTVSLEIVKFGSDLNFLRMLRRGAGPLFPKTASGYAIFVSPITKSVTTCFFRSPPSSRLLRAEFLLASVVAIGVGCFVPVLFNGRPEARFHTQSWWLRLGGSLRARATSYSDSLRKASAPIPSPRKEASSEGVLGMSRRTLRRSFG